MPAKSKSRITTACNSCRLRKQKCSGNRPTCIQCLQHRRNCDWPEQLKRGPAKGYIEALELRLLETENLLLGLLRQTSDAQLSSSISRPTRVEPRQGKRGTEYWRRFPLLSVQEIRSWQDDCQRVLGLESSTIPGGVAHTPTLTPCADTVEGNPRGALQEANMKTVQTKSPPSSELHSTPTLSVWSGAPSVKFQEQFLW